MIENFIAKEYCLAFEKIFGTSININEVQIQKTKSDFVGDFTCVVFPQVKLSKKSPEQTAELIGNELLNNKSFSGFNVVKGFLNISIKDSIWISNFLSTFQYSTVYQLPSNELKIMVEYSSPNTNKPLHLGHIRNNFLGYSLSKILQKAGYEVIKTQVINDRGIHICKSMLAWMKWGENCTPESRGIKGDHLVGEFYVQFEKELKKEIEVLVSKGINKDEAMQQSVLFQEAQEMLRKWEDGDAEVLNLWNKMNSWVYAGFDLTYKKMGVDFDVLYYESETYKTGKEIITEGLEKGVFYKREDGSVWCDLTKEGLDEKLVLRKDGTAVYITQDIGTAILRYHQYKINGMIYTVGNEQDYHFKVLFLILKKLGYEFYDRLYHLSYGMVELPSGRMKTREGTVVDADDLMDEMIATAAKANEEKGKLDGLSTTDINLINYKVGMSALKYFILKVDPRKGMVFNPEESIDFNGNTGPFILFNYVRTQSILKKSTDKNINEFHYDNIELSGIEKELIAKNLEYFNALSLAAKEYSPAIIANYAYDLAKTYSQFYSSTYILNEVDVNLRKFRLYLNDVSGKTLQEIMLLLGIEMPNRM